MEQGCVWRVLRDCGRIDSNFTTYDGHHDFCTLVKLFESDELEGSRGDDTGAFEWVLLGGMSRAVKYSVQYGLV